VLKEPSKSETKTFFKMSYFMFHRRKSYRFKKTTFLLFFVRVCNDIYFNYLIVV